MLQFCEDANLSQEAELTRLRGRIGVEDLEGDFPIVPEVSREVDRRESALSDFALDLVAPG